MGGTMFAGVAGDDVNLKAVTIQEAEPDGGTYLQIYNPKNNTLSRYYWGMKLDENEDPIEIEEGVYEGCWTDIEGDELTELPDLKAGQGFWLTIGQFNEDPAITIAGALYTTDTESETFTLELGKDVKDMHSNPMPAGEMNLKAIAIQEDEPDGGTYVQLYNPSDNTLSRYYWGMKFDENEDPIEIEEGVYEGCWTDIEGDPIDDKDLPDIPAGRGFWITTGQFNLDPAIIFPNPMYIKK